MPLKDTDYILVVDDDRDSRELMDAIVSTMGLKSRIAADGVEALRIAQESPPALVLLDLMMPNLNGFGVIARLYGSPTTRNVPVLIVTAAGRNEGMNRMPNVIGVMGKAGFDINGMMEVIARALHLEAH